jgi:hypothetical protein
MPGIERAGPRGGDVQGSVEAEVAVDIGQVVERATGNAGLAELIGEQRAAVQSQVAVDRQ